MQKKGGSLSCTGAPKRPAGPVGQSQGHTPTALLIEETTVVDEGALLVETSETDSAPSGVGKSAIRFSAVGAEMVRQKVGCNEGWCRKGKKMEG